MKLLLDEMLSPDIAEQLRQRGHDVIAVSERPDLRTEPDHVIFATAQEERRVLVTENIGDFRQIASAELQAARSHWGLVFTTNRSFPRHNARAIGRMIMALQALLLEDPDLMNRELWLT